MSKIPPHFHKHIHTHTHTHTHIHIHIHIHIQEVEFTPLTTVQEFLSQLNQEIGMPDTATTGFSLFSDWPGVEEDSCYYLFPQSKLCDIISMWTDSLEELNKVQLHRQQQRSIMLSYRNR